MESNQDERNNNIRKHVGQSGLFPSPTPVVYSTDRSKAVVPVLVLLFVALWFILRGDLFMSCLVLFCSCVFQSF